MEGAYRITPSDFSLARSLGFSLTTGKYKDYRVIQTLEGKPLWVYVYDEPNLKGISPDTVSTEAENLSRTSGLPSFITIWGPQYKDYRDSADIIGVDIYPWWPYIGQFVYSWWTKPKALRWLKSAEESLRGREWVGIPQSGSVLKYKKVAIPPIRVWKEWCDLFRTAGASHLLSYDYSGIEVMMGKK